MKPRMKPWPPSPREYMLLEIERFNRKIAALKKGRFLLAELQHLVAMRKIWEDALVELTINELRDTGHVDQHT